MFLSDEQDIRRLCREINLTDSETEWVLNNPGKYLGILAKIRAALQIYRKLLVEKTELEINDDQMKKFQDAIKEKKS